MLAALAVETGIAPQLLLEAPDDLLREMVAVLADRAEHEDRGNLLADLKRKVGGV